MLLLKPLLENYIGEIKELYRTELSEEIKSVTCFGILDGEELRAVASVKCYSGHWYLRSCIVKPEYRGQGFQKQLIRERLEYLATKTDCARVSVYPQNVYSIKNIEAEGFEFEKTKKLKNGKTVNVYLKRLR